MTPCHRVLLSLALGLLAGLPGCVTSREHRVINLGDRSLEEVTVEVAGYRFEHGSLPPGTHASYLGGMGIRKGDVVGLSWREQDGRIHTVTLPVTVNPNAREVIFILKDGTAAMRFHDPRPFP